KTELVRRQTVSRVLYSIALARNRAAIIHLGSGFPRNSSDLPGNIERAVHGALRRHVSLFGLAPCGVYQADPSPDRWCALTAPFHPCLCLAAIGGVLSVALPVPCGPPNYEAHCPAELGLSSSSASLKAITRLPAESIEYLLIYGYAPTKSPIPMVTESE